MPLGKILSTQKKEGFKELNFKEKIDYSIRQKSFWISIVGIGFALSTGDFNEALTNIFQLVAPYAN